MSLESPFKTEFYQHEIIRPDGCVVFVSSAEQLQKQYFSNLLNLNCNKFSPLMKNYVVIKFDSHEKKDDSEYAVYSDVKEQKNSIHVKVVVVLFDIGVAVNKILSRVFWSGVQSWRAG
jgi:hypothetical protein